MCRLIGTRSCGKSPVLSGVLMLALSQPVLADWHEGVIEQFGIAYDGSTIAFRLTGWSRNNCTCYADWPNQMCLDRSRASFKEEYAWILRARVNEQVIQINIDESTCKVLALFET